MTCLRVLLFAFLALQLLNEGFCRSTTGGSAVRAATDIECSGNGETTLELGQKITFTSKNYPENFPMFSKCSRKFQGPADSIIYLKCDFLHLSPITKFFVVDGGRKIEKTCLICLQDKYSFTFGTNSAEVGLETSIFPPIGFNCTVEAISDAPCNCGVSNKPTSRIIGGTEAEENEFPWAARLYIAGNPDLFFCGASLISNKHVLTAAHCVSLFIPQLLSVAFGAADGGNETEPSLIVAVDSIDVHPDFNTDTFPADVAVLTLRNGIDFIEYPNLRPICLAEDNAEEYVGQEATIAGWGATELLPTLGGSDSLMKATVNIFKIPFVDILDLSILKNRILAGADKKGTCIMDGGTSLMKKSKKGEYLEEIGVASIGLPLCIKIGQPDLYTRVSGYHDWILDQISESQMCSPPTTAAAPTTAANY